MADEVTTETTKEDKTIEEKDDLEEWFEKLNAEIPENKKEEPETNYVTKTDLETILGSFSDKIASAIKSKDIREEEPEIDMQAIMARLDGVDGKLNNSTEQFKKMLVETTTQTQLSMLSEQFESKVKERLPFFKVDKLHLEYDIRTGMSPSEALQKQYKAEQDRAENYTKQISTNAGVEDKDEVPLELKSFDATLHQDKNKFSKLTRLEKEVYWRKFDLFDGLKKRK